QYRSIDAGGAEFKIEIVAGGKHWPEAGAIRHLVEEARWYLGTGALFRRTQVGCFAGNDAHLRKREIAAIVLVAAAVEVAFIFAHDDDEALAQYRDTLIYTAAMTFELAFRHFDQ